MGTISNIVCKTVGIAGMSAVIYDAYSLGSSKAKKISESVSADFYEKVHASQRTLSYTSPVNNAIQSKVSEFRTNNPIIPAYGKVKGFMIGSLTSLGNNIVPTAFAALALTTKGFFSKVGAWGLAAYGIFIALKEGFGVGKQSPMD